MTDDANRSSVESQAGATMIIIVGYISSVLCFIAASILWIGFLIAATLAESAGLNRMTSGSITATCITVGNAAMFYFWGLYGMGQFHKYQKAALAKK
jgi:hypothetical protein